MHTPADTKPRVCVIDPTTLPGADRAAREVLEAAIADRAAQGFRERDAREGQGEVARFVVQTDGDAAARRRP